MVNMNVSTELSSAVTQSSESRALCIFRFVLFSLITLASLSGNFMVCKAVWGTRFKKPFSYYLVANMAVAEIINSLCLPFMLAWYESGKWILGQVGCSLVNPFQVLSVLVITTSMAFIAVYRLRVLTCPTERQPSRKVRFLLISCIWLVGLAVTFPLFVAFKLKDGSCVLDFKGNELGYHIARFILNFVVPYSVMLLSYGAVAWSLRQRIQDRALEHQHSTTSSFSATQNVALQEIREIRSRPGGARNSLRAQNARGMKTSNKLEKDLLKMIYVVIIVFVVCYFPYQVMYLWERIAYMNSAKFRLQKLVVNYVFIGTCLPSAIHPLCYGTMNKFYARAFSRIILCKRAHQAPAGYSNIFGIRHRA